MRPPHITRDYLDYYGDLMAIRVGFNEAPAYYEGLPGVKIRSF